MSEVIVVGVDNSETAKRAAVAAAKLATALGAELHVISGFSDDRIEEFGSGSDRITVSSADSAEYVARKVSEELDVPANSVKYYAARGNSGQRPDQLRRDQQRFADRRRQQAHEGLGPRPGQHREQRGTRCSVRRLHREHGSGRVTHPAQ